MQHNSNQIKVARIILTIIKREGGYRQQNMRQFLHILASPGTIAVNVTWMERGFNAGQMHSSIIYPSIFNRLRAIERYLSEIATFSYPLHLMPPLGVFPLEFWEKVWSSAN